MLEHRVKSGKVSVVMMCMSTGLSAGNGTVTLLVYKAYARHCIETCLLHGLICMQHV